MLSPTARSPHPTRSFVRTAPHRLTGVRAFIRRSIKPVISNLHSQTRLRTSLYGTMTTLPKTMKGCVLLGERRAEMREFPVPTPGPGEVLLKTKASSICASDLHCIYRPPSSSWTRDQEGYFGCIAGHEPAGQVMSVGPQVTRFGPGDRCCVFHVRGCDDCDDCRMHRPCSCTTPFDPDKRTGRMAYGWQTDGGMAEYILCKQSSLVKLPKSVSYLDGAMLACGYGTAYSGVSKAQVSGMHKVLVVGLGPVGLSVAQICRALGAQVDGYDIDEYRSSQASKFGVRGLAKADVPQGYDVVIECAGVNASRQMAVLAAKRWGTVVFLGGYNDVTLQVSPWVIQKQLTIRGSWTCSVTELETLCRKLVDWNVHPEELVSHTMTLDQTPEAYELFDKGHCSKVAIVFD